MRLTGVLSVGWIAALGVVAYLFGERAVGRRLTTTRGVRGLVDGLVSVVLAAYLPLVGYTSTQVGIIVGAMLFAHVRRPSAAGLCAGAAVVASYLSIIGAAILGVYVLLRDRRKGATAPRWACSLRSPCSGPTTWPASAAC
jgi:hypothetical protein